MGPTRGKLPNRQPRKEFGWTPTWTLTCSIGRIGSTACSGLSARYSPKSTAFRPDRNQAAHRAHLKRGRNGSRDSRRCAGAVCRRRYPVCPGRGSAAAFLYRLNSVSHQRTDQWIGQRGPGMGRRALDKVASGGCVAVMDLVAHGGGDEHWRSRRRCHLRGPRLDGLRSSVAGRFGGSATGVGAVAAQSPQLTGRYGSGGSGGSGGRKPSTQLISVWMNWLIDAVVVAQKLLSP